MSRFKPGLYIFHPINAPDGVNIAIENDLPPVPLPVRTLKHTEIWLVTASVNDTFNISVAVNDTDRRYNYKWIQDSNSLFALCDAVIPPTDFAITSAGNDVWTIQIPNKDSLLTFQAELLQLMFKPRGGTTAQHYQAIPMPGKEE